MKRQIVIPRLSNQGHVVLVRAAWAVILVCMVAQGMALGSGRPVHDHFAGKPTITMIVGLPGSDGQAQSSEAAPNPRELLTRALAHAAFLGESLERYLLLVEIAKAQCAIGDDQGARATIDRLSPREKLYRTSGLSEIAVAQASLGRIKEAMQTYAIIQPGIERSFAAGRIAVYQEKAGDRQGARETLQSIELPGLKVRALLELAMLRNSVGDRPLARMTIAEATELVAKDPQLSQNAERWCELGLVQAGVGEQAAAQEMFHRARQCADTKVDEVARAYDYYFVIRDQAKSGDVAGAWEASRKLNDERDVFGTRIKDKAIRAIALALTDARQLADAVQAIGQIQGPSERAHALAILAKAEERLGDHGRAKERLKVAVDLVENNSSSSSLRALAAIVNSWIALRDFEAAHTVAAMIESGTFRDDLVKKIAAAECRAGDLEAAFKTFQSIKDSEQKDECAQIVAAERVRKRVPQTLTWSERLATPSQRGHALVGMVEGLKAEPK